MGNILIEALRSKSYVRRFSEFWYKFHNCKFTNPNSWKQFWLLNLLLPTKQQKHQIFLAITQVSFTSVALIIFYIVTTFRRVVKLYRHQIFQGLFWIVFDTLCPRWPRDSQRKVLRNTFAVWSEATLPMMLSPTTARRTWTAWARRTCQCWRKTVRPFLSPAASTTCRCPTNEEETVTQIQKCSHTLFVSQFWLDGFFSENRNHPEQPAGRFLWESRSDVSG